MCFFGGIYSTVCLQHRGDHAKNLEKFDWCQHSWVIVFIHFWWSWQNKITRHWSYPCWILEDPNNPGISTLLPNPVLIIASMMCGTSCLTAESYGTNLEGWDFWETWWMSQHLIEFYGEKHQAVPKSWGTDFDSKQYPNYLELYQFTSTTEPLQGSVATILNLFLWL